VQGTQGGAGGYGVHFGYGTTTDVAYVDDRFSGLIRCQLLGANAGFGGHVDGSTRGGVDDASARRCEGAWATIMDNLASAARLMQAMTSATDSAAGGAAHGGGGARASAEDDAAMLGAVEAATAALCAATFARPQATSHEVNAAEAARWWFFTNGAVPHLLTAIAGLPNTSKRGLVALEHAIQGLTNIAFNTAAQGLLTQRADLGAVAVLVHRMRADAGIAEVQLKCARCLLTLMHENSIAQAQALAGDAVAVATAALARHPSHEFAVVKLTDLLLALAHGAEAPRRMREAKTEAAVRIVCAQAWLRTQRGQASDRGGGWGGRSAVGWHRGSTGAGRGGGAGVAVRGKLEQLLNSMGYVWHDVVPASA
jgi:hypothetical protein